jgi:hypothetical protein
MFLRTPAVFAMDYKALHPRRQEGLLTTTSLRTAHGTFLQSFIPHAFFTVIYLMKPNGKLQRAFPLFNICQQTYLCRGYVQ